MPELPETREIPGVKPKTIDQVDWSLFSRDPKTIERIRNLRKNEHLWFFDFYDYGVTLLEKTRGVKGGARVLGGHPQFEMTEEVVELLRENRPQRIFYEPEDIPTLLHGQKDLFVEHSRIGEILFWSIRFYPDSKYTDVFVKDMGRLDINCPSPKLKEGDRVYTPYLEVFYAADYEPDILIFRPKFEASFPTSKYPEIIGERLATHLGLSEKRVQANLTFQIQDPKSLKISVSKG